MLLLAAESLIERDVIATETIAQWIPRVFWILAVLVIVGLCYLVAELSTGQNVRRDEKARREMEGKPRG